MIPKIIFQTHEYRYDQLPPNFKQTTESWRNLNYGWQYRYYNKQDRDQYVLENSEELYKIYRKCKSTHKADIWRYLILYQEGGVYADMDSFCSTPMDYILKDIPDHIELVTTQIEKNDHINNANFAASKNSKVLLSCIKEIITEYAVVKNQEMIHGAFGNAAHRHKGTVLHTMKAQHGNDFKRSFDLSKIDIDYYGTEMKYIDFLSNPHMV
jgi:mannosyltransferase OCH1-like enzyme